MSVTSAGDGKVTGLTYSSESVMVIVRLLENAVLR